MGRAILQRHGRDLLVVNPPAMPLTTEELDLVAELPYVREPHPMYDSMGGVPAIEEVRFSVAHKPGLLRRLQLLLPGLPPRAGSSPPAP